jgi:hypothetical protein
METTQRTPQSTNLFEGEIFEQGTANTRLDSAVYERETWMAERMYHLLKYWADGRWQCMLPKYQINGIYTYPKFWSGVADQPSSTYTAQPDSRIQ